MSLLELSDVEKRIRSDRAGRAVLDGVSLTVASGEYVAIWGARRSGRTTLLRVAAGLEAPDAGSVRLRGQDLNSRRGGRARTAIAYCRKGFSPGEGRSVIDQLLSTQEALGVREPVARQNVLQALRRTSTEGLAGAACTDLRAAELARVSIARALTLQPELLVIDEPTLGLDPLERDPLLSLLRSLAQEGRAVLMSTAETPCLSFADRALRIGDGKLCGRMFTEEAEVVHLHAATRSAA